MNQEYSPQQDMAYTGINTKTRVNAFIQRVYYWMAAALAVTGVVAYFIASNFTLLSLFISFERRGRMLYATGVTPIWWICFAASVGVGIFFSARLNRISAAMATAVFLIYAVLIGAMLSPIFMVYTKTSIAYVFFICAVMFAATSVFGFFTKINFAGFFNFLFMGVFGILIVSFANIFIFKSEAIFMAVGYIGVFVFTGLSIYYTQKMKHMALTMPEDATPSMIRKASLNSALGLYASFINLFLMLLRIFGQRN